MLFFTNGLLKQLIEIFVCGFIELEGDKNETFQ